jgi:alkanesulfonate monooxygenase SsuD/methylene tetrahydromethanopterin reductase-like flavin-dependent oxidoreductase (luciferase family)
MARHPWVAQADAGLRWGVQLCAEQRRYSALNRVLHENPREALLGTGQLVEQLGFDGLFLYDHPSQAPDNWIWLSGLATVTERVWLGSVVNCVYHRHPVYLARMAADLDLLSQGRLVLGLGVGYLKREFNALGAEFMSDADRLRGLEEALAIIQGVWGDEPFTFDGRYYNIDRVRITPGPLQQPPPLMIGGSGEKVTLRNVAKYADACNLNAKDIPELRRKLDALQRHCEDLNRPYDEVLKTDFTGWLILAPTEAEAQAKINAMYPEGVPDTLAYLGILAGTPEQIAEHYQARADAGIEYFVVQVVDGMDRETVTLLANEVVPQVA